MMLFFFFKTIGAEISVQEQESVSELYLGRGILKLPFAQMPRHSAHPTHLTPSPGGVECQHLSEGWPHLCSSRLEGGE